MSFSSNSTIAKARAIYGRALTAEDYTQLCSKTSVAEAAAYLKQTDRFHAVLARINPQTIHRTRLEALIAKNILDIFERFHKFDFSSSRPFFKYIIMELEAEQILTAIEGVAAGSTDDYIADLPVFLTQHAQTDLLALGNAESFLDIARGLDGTSFAKALRPLLIDAAESGRIDINECERRLFTLYYMSALKTVDQIYSGKDKDDLRHALLKSIDMVNIVTCYRMKKFSFSADKIRNQLLPFRYRLNAEAIDRLIELDSTEAIAKELSKMGYHINEPAQFDTIEQLTERISTDSLRRTIRLSQNSAAVYYSLIECLRTEQRNIKTAIEGIRYGISSSDILDMLVI